MPISRRSALAVLAVAALAACQPNLSSPSPAASPEPSPGAPHSPAADLVGALKGSGASSQDNAQQTWARAFTNTFPDATVSYSPQDSAAGRERVLAAGVDFAGTDTPMTQEEREQDDSLIEVPVYVSPVAVAFNVPGFGGVRHINLSAEVAARIFRQEVTKWDDEQILALNQGVELPSLDIVVLHRDGSCGTTKVLTGYLSEAAPQAWPETASEQWPHPGQTPVASAVEMVARLESTPGAIGYLEASQVRAQLGTAAIGAQGRYRALSLQAANATLAGSGLAKDATYTHVVLDVDHTIADSYPLLLVSYVVARSSYPQAETAATMRSYLEYLVSEEGQNDAAQATGCVPLPGTLREQALRAISVIG